MEPRRSEKFAYEIVRRMLEVDVEHVDDNRTPGHYDAAIRYPDGRTAALEVTTIGDQSGMELRSMDHRLAVPTSLYAWDFRYPGAIRMKDVHKFVPSLVMLCDQFGVEEPHSLPSAYLRTPEMVWYNRGESELRRLAPSKHEGTVYVLPQATGGAVDERLDGLEVWIDSQLDEPWYVDNVAKLARSGLDELHLFVLVAEDAVEFSLFSGLMDNGPIALGETVGFEPLTSLWLLPSYGQSVTRWTRGVGWIRERYEAHLREV